MALVWTTPVRPGGTSSTTQDFPFVNGNNIVNGSDYCYWDADWESGTGDYLHLVNWDITIPGGADAITQMKVDFEITHDEVDRGKFLIRAIGGNNNYSKLAIGSSWSADSASRTPDAWGLTNAEAMAIANNSSSTGIKVWFQTSSTGDVWYYLRNVKLSFEYDDSYSTPPPSTGPSGLILGAF